MEDMKTRFTLYGFGFVIGIIIVFFFLGGKKASCNWLPNDRILNIIGQKKLIYSENLQADMLATGVDSLEVIEILRAGDIDFSKSNVKNDPCRNYWIEGPDTEKNLVITVELCDSIATVKSLFHKGLYK